MFQWHHNGQQCSPEKKWWGSRLPARCPRFTSAHFWLFQSPLVAQETRLASLSPPLPTGLPCLHASSCKFPPLHHPLFLWQCSADYLRWGLFWVDVYIEWRRGFHPCHKKEGRVWEKNMVLLILIIKPYGLPCKKTIMFHRFFLHACMLSPVSFASYLVTLVCPSVTFNFNVYTHIEEAK